MQKTKFALVSLLSLLVVFAPVSSALAETEGVSEPIEPSEEKGENQEKNEVRSSSFEDIEEQGGEEISDKQLDEKEGEGGILALVGIGIAIWDGVSSGLSPSKIARNAFALGVAGAAAPSIV